MWFFRWPARQSGRANAAGGDRGGDDNGVDAAGVRLEALQLRRAAPQGWLTYDAEADWGGEHLTGPGSVQFANLTDPGGTRTLMAAAATVPTGMQLADWQAAIVRGTPRASPNPGLWKRRRSVASRLWPGR